MASIVRRARGGSELEARSKPWQSVADPALAGPRVCVALLAEAQGPTELRTRRALERLGAGGRGGRGPAAELRRRLRAGGVDLVVLEGALRAPVDRVLAARGPDDPPVLVVTPAAAKAR